MNGHPRTHPRNPLRLWQRQAVDASGGALLLSGAAWLALHYGRSAELPLPAEAWLMRLHGAAAFAAIFMLGALAAFHVPQGWRVTARGHGLAQRRWGLLLCVLGALLVASAYQLYYFAPDNVRPALGIAHSLAGLAMALALVMHRRIGRRPLLR
jgi:peptidoglycan/LPS O-acetylase OafA/YrhL